jgi:hypothetical protein
LHSLGRQCSEGERREGVVLAFIGLETVETVGLGLLSNGTMGGRAGRKAHGCAYAFPLDLSAAQFAAASDLP